MADEIKSPLQPDNEGNIVEETAAPEVDLEKKRDEKCIPVARAMFADIASDMIQPDADISDKENPLLSKLLQKGVDADLNLVTENPYVFQLMLGQLAGMHKTVQECEVIPIDDVRYGTIASKMLQIVSDSNVTLGSVTPEETTADFVPVKEKLDALFIEEKLSHLEVKYIMEGIFKSFETLNSFFDAAVNQSLTRIEEKLMDVDSISDITMGMIIDMQQKLAKN